MVTERMQDSPPSQPKGTKKKGMDQSFIESLDTFCNPTKFRKLAQVQNFRNFTMLQNCQILFYTMNECNWVLVLEYAEDLC